MPLISHKLVAYNQRIGVLPAYSYLRRTATGSQAAILMYHRVSPDGINCLTSSISPDLFEKQIEYLLENFQVISLDNLADLVANRKLWKKMVVITFDDGYKDNFKFAYPILKKYKIPATFFVTTGYINNNKLFWWDIATYFVMNMLNKRSETQNYGKSLSSSKVNLAKKTSEILISLKKMPDQERLAVISKMSKSIGEDKIEELGKEMVLTWKEIKEMASKGIQFGAHTVNHPILTNVSPEVCRKEIDQSKKDIEDVLCSPVSSFSYPAGFYNHDIVKIVKQAGFKCATSSNPYGLIGQNANLFTLRRIGVLEDLHFFKGMLSGVAGDFSFLYRRAKPKPN
jgi:peptidoglycan/xylan/chitin deacetylase (PgdA/CDA1 family)